MHEQRKEVTQSISKSSKRGDLRNQHHNDSNCKLYVEESDEVLIQLGAEELKIEEEGIATLMLSRCKYHHSRERTLLKLI